MSWFKKLAKKSRKPYKHPAPLGISSHISSAPTETGAEVEADVGPEGAF